MALANSKDPTMSIKSPEKAAQKDKQNILFYWFSSFNFKNVMQFKCEEIYATMWYKINTKLPHSMCVLTKYNMVLIDCFWVPFPNELFAFLLLLLLFVLLLYLSLFFWFTIDHQPLDDWNVASVPIWVGSFKK